MNPETGVTTLLTSSFCMNDRKRAGHESWAQRSIIKVVYCSLICCTLAFKYITMFPNHASIRKSGKCLDFSCQPGAYAIWYPWKSLDRVQWGGALQTLQLPRLSIKFAKKKKKRHDFTSQIAPETILEDQFS